MVMTGGEPGPQAGRGSPGTASGGEGVPGPPGEEQVHVARLWVVTWHCLGTLLS